MVARCGTMRYIGNIVVRHNNSNVDRIATGALCSIPFRMAWALVFREKHASSMDTSNLG